jgi:hypothetical protein
VRALELFVHHPLRILALGVVLLVPWALLRRSGSYPNSNALLAPSGLCALFAAWEWLVMTRTPEADIRVDLLLAWPLLLLVTVASALRALRG